MKTLARVAPWLVLAAALRFWGVSWGLPGLYNADEPHFINTAVSFGSGSLNPHTFKYPTLWMYTLAASYGASFLAWSAFGLRATAAQFACLFACHPAPFYLLGRCLSALFSLLGLLAVAKLERPGRIYWAVVVLAVSPYLIYSAHEAKADSLMFFLSALAWVYGVKVYAEGRTRDYLLTGLFAGLALSTQYTALPVLLIVPAAHLASRRRRPLRPLAAAIAVSGAAFIAASPFIALDWPAFLSSLRDHAAYLRLRPSAGGLGSLRFLGHPLLFAGSWSLAGLAFPIGLWRLRARDARLASMLLLPWAAYCIFMFGKPDNVNLRYFYACLPAFALICAEGLSWMSGLLPGRGWTALLLAATIGPGAWAAARQDLRMSRPDTRGEAAAWIDSNIPQGSGILIDEAWASPPLKMSRAQALELGAKAKALGSRRARYYDLLAHCHHGGGYRIYIVRRSAKSLGALPALAAKAQRDGPYLDVGSGLAAAVERGVRYVVTTSYFERDSAPPSRLGPFFNEVRRRGRLLASFVPGHGLEGPALRVYDVGGETD
ncbi:MAG: glycosyltransferase family 39 protein [Elusimicrobia bacterium]|nr:glycosyltransferase family 39 protein [Elusimicrobiota bacterium]MDE2424330.1 glycosyltransferase family 39 protein [Elusimicrobiota bacterium]